MLILKMRRVVSLHVASKVNQCHDCELSIAAGLRLKQLRQTHLPITGDEGVYRIARASNMNNPTEFNNLILCLESFHLIKVVMGVIHGSDVDIIFAESKAFGTNVVRSVIDGTHYKRSLKGLMLLSEWFEGCSGQNSLKAKALENI